MLLCLTLMTLMYTYMCISTALPPYIPSVCTPDDTTNFDDFETQHDCDEDKFTTPQSQKGQRGFSGRSLPFVGFTFTRMDSMNFDLDLTDQEEERYVLDYMNNIIHVL